MKRKKNKEISFYKENKISYYDALFIFYKSNKEIFKNIIEYKFLFLFLFFLQIINVYSYNLLETTNLYFEEFSAREIIYYNDPIALFSYILTPLIYFLSFMWFFTFLSVKHNFKYRLLNYITFILPRFYFYNLLFLSLLFVVFWLFFALLKNNFDFLTIGNFLNSTIRDEFVLWISNNSTKAIILFSLIFFKFLLFSLLLFYFYLTFFYIGYCKRMGVIFSLSLSFKFVIKNIVKIIIFLLYSIITVSLLSLISYNYFGYGIIPVVLYVYYFNVLVVSNVMKNSILKIKY